jgi:hypothetical protein
MIGATRNQQRCIMSKEEILEVMEEAMPCDERAIWLDLPNLDLNGLTPREALDEKQYDQLIEALWLRGPLGPVS